MVLQVLSDAGQMMPAFDAVFGKRRAVADAGQHQKLRRLERARRYDDLAAGADLPRLLALAGFDADRALAFEQDARRLRKSLDAQIRARCHVRMQIGPRGAPALAVLLRHLIDPEALMVPGVEILADAKLRFLGGLQENLLHRIARTQLV